MRLLLRANSHRRLAEDETEIAASPDTPHRERWQWDLRIVGERTLGQQQERRSASVSSVRLNRSDGSASQLALSVDPEAVIPEIETLDLSVPTSVERTDQELVAIVVGSGVALIEGRHVLCEMDGMVLAGDDPPSVRIEQVSDESVSIALVRLRPRGLGSLAWVP